MKKFMRFINASALSTFIAVCMTSCFGGGTGQPTSSAPGGYSKVTGREYVSEAEDDEDEIDAKKPFVVRDFNSQPEGPNLRFIEGGRTVLGTFEEDILHSRDNVERAVTVASFYLDETETANIHWLEYLFDIREDSIPEFYESALPDTTVWNKRMAYNDPYVDHYLRYPGFRFFPVVGVSWLQAQDYCTWRTKIVNYELAKEAGYYDEEEELGESDPSERAAPALESGIVLPNYRLPTEAEWEYAAQALIGTQWLDENQTHRRLYPWDGHALRNPYGKKIGTFLANFKRGRGDYAGIAGKLNDGAMITTYIYDYPPNDFGLYNMAGNVNEWVQDVYRPLSFQDFDDLNPVRRDGFLDEENGYDAANFNSLITDRVRVFKGGSWADVAYWMSPGTRRYLEEDSSTSTVGFRCAMIRAGTNY